MNQAITKSELLSRYVAEVKRTIGVGAPKDVDRELESLLAESIEAREAEAGRELSLDEVAGILREFGAPQVVADRYSPRPRYLIGPGLYPLFKLVAKAILGVAAGVPLLLLLVSRLAEEFPPVSTSILNWVGLSYQIAFGGLAWAVLVFAVLERLGISERRLGSLGATAEPWNPLDLPASEDPSRVSRVGSCFSIYFIVVFLTAFNLFPEWVGLYVFKSGSQPRVLSLRELGIHLPMWQLNLWWLAALVQNLLLFRSGRWTAVTRWSQFCLGLCGAAILYPLIGSISNALRREPFTTVVTNPQLAGLLARLAHQVLIVVFVVVLVTSVYRLYRLVRVRAGVGAAGTPGPII